MRTPNLYSAMSIANGAQEEFEQKHWIYRLYDIQPRGILRLLTRIRIAWAVFVGEYDALFWEYDDALELSERLTFIRRFRCLFEEDTKKEHSSG